MPPLTVAVAEPVLKPHSVLVEVILTVKAGGSATITLVLYVQLLASFTVIV